MAHQASESIDAAASVALRSRPAISSSNAAIFPNANFFSTKSTIRKVTSVQMLSPNWGVIRLASLATTAGSIVCYPMKKATKPMSRA